MVSLFIDTSKSTLILGILNDNIILEEIKIESLKNHNLYVLENIDILLKKCKLNVNDIKKIYVVSGPGSFTGTRVGITIAKTLAYTLNIKICSVSSLILPIFNYDGYDFYISIIKDNDSSTYIGIYDKDYNKVKEELIKNNQINNLIDNYKNSIIVDSEYNISNFIPYFNDKYENVHSIKPNYIKEVI